MSLDDLINKKFGKLTVLEKIRNENGSFSYKCICVCGKELFSTKHKLISGRNRSCGCSRKKIFNLIGKFFGQLKVISFSTKKYFYECVCECGKSIILNGYQLMYGQTTSCGCKYQSNFYEFIDEHVVVKIKNGPAFKIDVDDLERVKQHDWCQNDDGYIVSTEKNQNGWKGIKLHRYIMKVENPEILVDHKNHDLLDYRKQNLRLCNLCESSRNRKTPKHNKSSKIRGITKYKNRWIVRIGVDGKRLYLGSFESIEDAIKIRNESEKKYFGEFNYNKNEDVRFLNNEV